jgi:hypothetical protein
VFITKCEFDNTRMEGLLLLKGGMFQAISEIESKSYKA